MIVLKKVLFISSTGGHLSELLQLKPLFGKYDYHIVTEKTDSTISLKKEYGDRISYLIYGTKHHMFSYVWKTPVNIFRSLYLFFRIRPNVVVTTGAHTAVWMCYIAKVFRKKVIYIETLANIKRKTLSGKLVYPICDKFIVQWESMKELYPKAIYGGWIF